MWLILPETESLVTVQAIRQVAEHCGPCAVGRLRKHICAAHRERSSRSASRSSMPPLNPSLTLGQMNFKPKVHPPQPIGIASRRIMTISSRFVVLSAIRASLKFRSRHRQNRDQPQFLDDCRVWTTETLLTQRVRTAVAARCDRSQPCMYSILPNDQSPLTVQGDPARMADSADGALLNRELQPGGFTSHSDSAQHSRRLQFLNC